MSSAKLVVFSRVDSVLRQACDASLLGKAAKVLDGDC